MEMFANAAIYFIWLAGITYINNFLSLIHNNQLNESWCWLLGWLADWLASLYKNSSIFIITLYHFSLTFNLDFIIFLMRTHIHVCAMICCAVLSWWCALIHRPIFYWNKLIGQLVWFFEKKTFDRALKIFKWNEVKQFDGASSVVCSVCSCGSKCEIEQLFLVWKERMKKKPQRVRRTIHTFHAKSLARKQLIAEKMI